MKILKSFFMVAFASCCFFSLQATSQDDSSSDEDKPEVVADISPKAIEDSTSFDGARLFGGIVLSSSEQSNSIYGSSLAGSTVVTKNNFTPLGVTVGAEYAKSFKKIKAIKDFLCSIGIMLDISQKKKRSGTWMELNAAYNSVRSSLSGTRTAILETGTVVPSIMLKIAYRIPSIQSAVYLKLLLSRKTAKQAYYLSSTTQAIVNISTFVPVVGVGIEYKITDKLGIALEGCFSLKRSINKLADTVQHSVSLAENNIRLLATYSMPSL